MQAALEAVAEAGGLPGCPDGVQWEREVRAERPAPVGPIQECFPRHTNKTGDA